MPEIHGFYIEFKPSQSCYRIHSLKGEKGIVPCLHDDHALGADTIFIFLLCTFTKAIWLYPQYPPYKVRIISPQIYN